ncbi:MAG: c-type cytochrome [Hyphomicrobiaceae bacterium]
MVIPKSMLSFRLVVGALGCMAFNSVQAATLGSPDKGKIYAQTHCVSCHSVVRDGNSSPVTAATPFQTIANTAGITRTALFVFFRSPHPTMPNLIIRGDDLDDIIAYILSLKTANQ